jgi:iron complex outermembrane receptor protein
VYEAGYKAAFFDQQLRVQLAAYYNDFEDLLSTRFDDINGSAVAVFGNAGAVTAKGLEAEVNWSVTPDWDLTMMATMTNAEYGDFVTPNPLASGGETINGIDNLLQLDGEQVQQTPDYTVTLQSNYYIDLGDNGSLQPSISVYITDDYRTNDLPWTYGTQEGYARVDASITWNSFDGDFSVQAFANNVTDEEILVRSVRFGGDIIVGDYAPPATYGIRAGYKF